MVTQVITLLDKLPPYRGDKDMVVWQQQTFDIITEVVNMHNNTANYYNNIAVDHWQGNPLDTARELYTFAKKHLPYKEEKTTLQTIKEPQAILSERHTHGNDCKHYASYLVGIGQALKRYGYPVDCFYRFASYDRTSKRPTHVFAVWVIGGREYWIDPVPQIKCFNDRSYRPTFFIDKKFGATKSQSLGSLYKVGAIHTNWYDDMFSNHHAVGAKKKKHKAHHGLHLKIKAPHIKIQPGKLFKKVAMAPSRNAFLLYLKINLFHTGSKLYDKITHDAGAKKKVFDLWSKIGGNTNKLMTALTQARNVWNKHHKNRKITEAVHGFEDEHMNGYGDYIGVAGADDAGYAGIIAAASPVIKMFSNLLKSFKISHAGDKEIADAHDEAMDAHNDATHEKGDGNADIQDDGSVDHGNGIKTKVTKDAQGNQVVNYDVPDDGGGGGGANTSVAKQKGGSGGDDNSTDDNTDVTSTSKSVPASSSSDSSVNILLSKAKDFASEHKTAIIVGTASIAALIVIPKLFHHVKKRGRK